MKDADRTIKVPLDTSLAELIEQIGGIPEEIIRLEVPKGSKILRSEIGLRLLKEKVGEFNKKLVFLTDDEMGKILLARGGFIVKPLTKTRPESGYFEALSNKPQVKITDIYPSAKKTIFPQPSEAVPAQKKPPIKTSPTPQPRIKRVSPIEETTFIPEVGVITGRKKRGKILYLIGFIIGLIVVVFAVSYLILPSAKIVISPTRKKEPLSATIGIATTTETVNSATNEIPGQFFEFEQQFSMSFPATGKTVVEERATGKVKVYNAYSSSPQILVARTRFLSSDGKVFRIVKQIQIPGAKIEEGKIIPSSITIEL